MNQKRVTQSRLLPLVMLLIAIFAGAQVYKWVDEKGQVHFGDCPPDDCEVEELTLPKGPTDEEIEAAQEKLRKELESRKARDEAEQSDQREIWSDDFAEDLLADESFNRCVEARYQLTVLERRGRAFKLKRDWTRNYLEDGDRPAEISRLNKLVDVHCDTDVESVKKQNQRVSDIKDALNIRCVAAREKLQKLKEPESDTDKLSLKEAQRYVDLNCPAIELHDLWIADWKFVRGY